MQLGGSIKGRLAARPFVSLLFHLPVCLFIHPSLHPFVPYFGTTRNFSRLVTSTKFKRDRESPSKILNSMHHGCKSDAARPPRYSFIVVVGVVVVVVVVAILLFRK